ncbi:MAG: hypothetical protein ABW198_06630 [Pseudorhodoplanes sp.]
MLNVQNMSEMVGLPIWMIGTFAVVIAALLAIAVARLGSLRGFGFFGQAAGLALLAGMAWLYLDRLGEQDRADYRRNIEARVSALTAQSLLPNSNLACLDATSEDLLQEACEKSLYSSAEQVSAALTFVGARLDILRDIAALAHSEEQTYEKLRMPLVRSIQADRFGLVAQVLQSRDGCSAEICYAFDFLRNNAQLVANMRERTYEARLSKHAAAWSDKPVAPPVAAASPVPPSPAAPPKESQLNLNFPSASSIPPVSIMANEPGMPGQNGIDSAAKPDNKQPAGQAPVSAQAPAKRPPQKAAAQPKQPPRPGAAAAPAADQQADPFPQPVAPPVQTSGGPAGPRPQ